MPGTNDERMHEDKMIQEKPAIQREGPNEEEVKMASGAIQTKANGGGQVASAHLSTRIEKSSGKGNPLPAGTKSEMESSFGADFSHVNIHTGPEASEMNNSLRAQAFTHGPDIFFNSGKFNPSYSGGKHLLAHELTHVLQQTGKDRIDPKRIQRFSWDDVGEMLSNAGSGIKNTILNAGQRIGQGAQNIYNRVTGRATEVSDRAREAGQIPRQRPEKEDPSNFCVAYSSNVEAIASKIYLNSVLLPMSAGMFGPEVMNIWYHYLHDPSSSRKFYKEGSTIAYGFRSSQIMRQRVNYLMRLAANRYYKFLGIPGNAWSGLPVADIFSEDEIKYGINFSNPFDIPGHIAGGISGGAGGPDTREMKGSVKAFPETDASGALLNLKLLSDFQFEVNDTVDFCPGGTGAGIEQALTIPLSRLEASGKAWDVPFTVNFNTTPISVVLKGKDLTYTSSPNGVPLDTDQPEDRRSRGDRSREATRGLDEKKRASDRLNSR
jgi:hypothetical protein